MSNQKVAKEKIHTFDWRVAVITAVIVLAVAEGWHFIKDRARYQLSYQIKISPHKLEYSYLSLFKKSEPATKVEIIIVNRGLKAQKNVGLYIRFKKPIIFTYVAKEIPVYDNNNESLIGNAKAFMWEKAAGFNMPIIPSGCKSPITFILDCAYSKEMKDKDKLIEFFKLTSETK